MEIETRTSVVRCETTHTPLFRPDPEGRGALVWCRGHHREELQTWKRLGITRAVLMSLLCEELGITRTTLESLLLTMKKEP